jgi:rubrerythrin
MNLKGSKTEQNLWSAFEGESKVRMKYTYYASQADKEGYKQMAAIFQETADNEKEHAKRFFKFLIGGSIRPTEENLLEAAEGELHEHSKLYP